ncbi:hypothetical protein JTE90_029663 [Oedothorax gibbosus]|uniref:E3 ubiquitin-protein ligase RNF25 n=1 Tax=Oedothorax gibbosus TaxID=931172 RepID=A0AAV6VGI7_9ARAC|nr:hypothetical protein JTE90_029663 [Oedothorax gibbosus]
MEEEDIETIPSVETDGGQCSLETELEALQSIYVNEVEVVHNENSTTVSINLHPATADKLDEQYVMLTLKFSLDAEYPHKIPEIHIRNPRGLSDDKLASISEDLKSIAESKIGNSMLFEVIEAAKEHLTEFNRPCGECAICLYSFSDEDVFTKTECYHYFHSHCLARYSVKALNTTVEDERQGEKSPDKELLCPVCRLVIHFSGSEDDFPSPSLLRGDEDPVISQDVIEIQKKMADLFQKQVDKGGIIDLEAEKNKYLLEISQVPTRSDAASPSDLSKEEETDNVPAQNEDNSKDSKNPSKTTVTGEEKTKTDKRNKQPRNKYDPVRNNNKRYDESYGRFKSDRERRPRGASGKTVCDGEQNYNDNDSNEKSSAARSERNSYKRNNNYGPPRRYYDEDGGRGRDNRYSNYRGGNRGRGYPSNGYDRNSYQDRGYRGRGGRPRFERETSDEQSDLPRKEKAEDKELTEPESPNSSVKIERDNSKDKNEKDFEKKHSDGAHSKRESNARTKQDTWDSCPDRDSRNQKLEEDSRNQKLEKENRSEAKGKYYNDRRYPEKSQNDSYRGRRNYPDRRYDERDTRFPRRGGYDDRDGYNNRGYYGRNNRGSYRNSNYRDNFERHAQPEGRRPKAEDCNEEDVNKGSDSHRFSDQRSGYRGNRGNPRRNERSREQDFPERNEKSEGFRNGVSDSPENKNSHTESCLDIEPKSGGHDDDKVEESNSKKLPQRHEGYSRSYKDKRNYNSQRDYRDSDRNRPNSEAQGNNSHYKRNQRFNPDRDYRNNSDSYQYRNNSSRSYNGNQLKDSEEFFTSTETTVAKPADAISTPAAANEKELTHQELTQSKVRSNETLSKDPSSSLPPVKPTANFATGSPKMPQPPPGFSNPLKKVVYGLKAANAPPGFSSRS